MKFKKRIFKIIEKQEDGDTLSRIFDVFIIVLICINVIMVIADTFNLPEILRKTSKLIEVISVIIFCKSFQKQSEPAYIANVNCVFADDYHISFNV